MLRALALVTVLGLHSTAGAVEAAFHLCNGAAQFNQTCCCSADDTAAEGPTAVAQPHGACCSELSADLAESTLATSASSAGTWTPPPFHVQPAVVAPATTQTELLVFEWLRTRGVHRATAPPLFIQNCSYLI